MFKQTILTYLDNQKSHQGHPNEPIYRFNSKATLKVPTIHELGSYEKTWLKSLTFKGQIFCQC